MIYIIMGKRILFFHVLYISVAVATRDDDVLNFPVWDFKRVRTWKFFKLNSFFYRLLCILTVVVDKQKSLDFVLINSKFWEMEPISYRFLIEFRFKIEDYTQICSDYIHKKDCQKELIQRRESFEKKHVQKK